MTNNNSTSKKALRKAAKTIDAIMVWVANSLGTNACIVLFLMIAVVPLWYQLPVNVMAWQQWTSGTFIQLVALGLLAKVAGIEGLKTFKLLKETHDTVMIAMQTLRDDQISADENRQSIHADIMAQVQILKDDQISANETRTTLQSDIQEVKQLLTEIKSPN